MKLCLQRPVFQRLERANLALAFHNQPQRHRLHAPCRQSTPHLVPQQRRNLVAHQPIEHASRLLRGHQVLVDVARMLECFLHSLFCNLVEGDAVNLLSLFGVGPQLDREVVRNRLAFAVRVRREINLVGLGARLL